MVTPLVVCANRNALYQALMKMKSSGNKSAHIEMCHYDHTGKLMYDGDTMSEDDIVDLHSKWKQMGHESSKGLNHPIDGVRSFFPMFKMKWEGCDVISFVDTEKDPDFGCFPLVEKNTCTAQPSDLGSKRVKSIVHKCDIGAIGPIDVKRNCIIKSDYDAIGGIVEECFNIAKVKALYSPDKPIVYVKGSGPDITVRPMDPMFDEILAADVQTADRHVCGADCTEKQKLVPVNQVHLDATPVEVKYLHKHLIVLDKKAATEGKNLRHELIMHLCSEYRDLFKVDRSMVFRKSLKEFLKKVSTPLAVSINYIDVMSWWMLYIQEKRMKEHVLYIPEDTVHRVSFKATMMSYFKVATEVVRDTAAVAKTVGGLVADSLVEHFKKNYPDEILPSITAPVEIDWMLAASALASAIGFVVAAIMASKVFDPRVCKLSMHTKLLYLIQAISVPLGMASMGGMVEASLVTKGLTVARNLMFLSNMHQLMGFESDKDPLKDLDITAAVRKHPQLKEAGAQLKNMEFGKNLRDLIDFVRHGAPHAGSLLYDSGDSVGLEKLQSELELILGQKDDTDSQLVARREALANLSARKKMDLVSRTIVAARLVEFASNYPTKQYRDIEGALQALSKDVSQTPKLASILSLLRAQMRETDSLWGAIKKFGWQAIPKIVARYPLETISLAGTIVVAGVALGTVFLHDPIAAIGASSEHYESDAAHALAQPAAKRKPYLISDPDGADVRAVSKAGLIGEKCDIPRTADGKGILAPGKYVIKRAGKAAKKVHVFESETPHGQKKLAKEKRIVEEYQPQLLNTPVARSNWERTQLALRNLRSTADGFVQKMKRKIYEQHKELLYAALDRGDYVPAEKVEKKGFESFNRIRYPDARAQEYRPPPPHYVTPVAPRAPTESSWLEEGDRLYGSVLMRRVRQVVMERHESNGLEKVEYHPRLMVPKRQVTSVSKVEERFEDVFPDLPPPLEPIEPVPLFRGEQEATGWVHPDTGEVRGSICGGNRFESETGKGVFRPKMLSVVELFDKDGHRVQNGVVTTAGILCNRHSVEKVARMQDPVARESVITFKPSDVALCPNSDLALLKVSFNGVAERSVLRRKEIGTEDVAEGTEVIMVSIRNGRNAIHTAIVDGPPVMGPNGVQQRYRAETEDGDCGAAIFDTANKLVGIHFYRNSAVEKQFIPASRFKKWLDGHLN